MTGKHRTEPDIAGEIDRLWPKLEFGIRYLRHSDEGTLHVMYATELRELMAWTIASKILHPNEVFMSGPYRAPSDKRRCEDGADTLLEDMKERGYRVAAPNVVAIITKLQYGEKISQKDNLLLGEWLEKAKIEPPSQ